MAPLLLDMATCGIPQGALFGPLPLVKAMGGLPACHVDEGVRLMLLPKTILLSSLLWATAYILWGEAGTLGA